MAAACAALAGCGRGDERDELSAANVLYERGHAALEGGDFRKALRFLGTLKRASRSTRKPSGPT